MRNGLIGKTLVGVSIGAVAFMTAPAMAQCGSGGGAMAVSYESKSYGKDIVETAKAAGQFNTLLAAAKAAGLAEALKGDGPLTVFAPTDEAFAKLPDGTVASLLKPENKQKLQAILKYHVVSGKLKAADVVKQPGAVSLQGQQIDFTAKDGKVMADGARVVKADVKASNGVIHVIDSVILPADKNIVELAKSAGQFDTLLAAAKAAGLASTLAEDGPFTIFAPTDDAFAKLPAGTVESLLKPENRDQLKTILKLHVVEGRVYSGKVVTLDEAKTLAGQTLPVHAKDGVKVGQSKVVKTDLDASNGVVHVIDTVILPTHAQETARAGY